MKKAHFFNQKAEVCGKGITMWYLGPNAVEILAEGITLLSCQVI